MASTFTLASAITLAKYLIKGYAIDDNAIRVPILQNSVAMFWMAAPWQWTVGDLADVTITAGAEDHIIGSFPADFFGLDTVSLYDTTSPDKAPSDLYIEPFLRSSPLTGEPQKVAHVLVSATNKYRIRPYYHTSHTNTCKLLGTYKKKMPILDSSNISVAGTQVFDDEWFWVFQEIVDYWAYMYSDDPRAEKKLLYITKEIIPYMKSIYGLPLDSYRLIEEKRRES